MLNAAPIARATDLRGVKSSGSALSSVASVLLPELRRRFERSFGVRRLRIARDRASPVWPIQTQINSCDQHAYELIGIRRVWVANDRFRDQVGHSNCSTMGQRGVFLSSGITTAE